MDRRFPVNESTIDQARRLRGIIDSLRGEIRRSNELLRRALEQIEKSRETSRSAGSDAGLSSRQGLVLGATPE
jgi:hypothetical protein